MTDEWNLWDAALGVPPHHADQLKALGSGAEVFAADFLQEVAA